MLSLLQEWSARPSKDQGALRRVSGWGKVWKLTDFTRSCLTPTQVSREALPYPGPCTLHHVSHSLAPDPLYM